MKRAFLAAAAASVATLAAAATPAAASTYLVTNVGLDNGFNVSINGGGYELAGAIGLTLQGDPKTLWVWCVDIYHTIGLGSYNPPLAYVTASVSTDSSGSQSGTGNPLSAPIPGEIATLADIGTGIANANGNPNDLSAIQAAIWQVEYNATVTSGNTADDALIAKYVAFAQAHPQAGDPNGFYPAGAGQGFGYSQGFTMGVPEPATWAMMLVGFGGLGAAMRSRRRLAAATA